MSLDQQHRDVDREGQADRRAIDQGTRPDREETRELISGLDDEAISRLAQAGSTAALRELVQRWGDREETRELISHLVQAGSTKADSFLAWRDWALATVGPSGLADLYAGGVRIPLSTD